MVVVAGVSVDGTGLDVSVAETVAGAEVCVEETVVEVDVTGVWVGVITPLQAATVRTKITINFFIYLFSFTSVASTSTISPEASSKLLSSAC